MSKRYDAQFKARVALDAIRGGRTLAESEPDRVIYQAMDKGLIRSKGEWFIFLGADDFLMGLDVLDRVSHFLGGC